MPMDIENLTAHEALDMLNRGDCSSEELVKDTFAAITAKDGDIGAYVYVDEDQAAEQARAADKARAEGGTGKLLGVPVAIKDVLNVRGQPCTCGSRILKGYTSPYDATSVARLREEGAVLLGRSNMDEFAMGSTTENSAIKATRNPRNLDFVPGGSSGGSAAAVAGGEAIVSLGTDTGGSVRIPPALTGIVGFRPSSGRYPSEAVTPISHTRDTVGLLSRTVSDLIVLDDVIVEAGEPVTAIPASEIRLGVPRAFYYENLDQETAIVIEAVLARITEAGAQLIETEVPDIGDLLERSAFPIALYEVERDLPAYLEEFDTGVGFAELSAAVASPDVHGVFGIVTGKDRITDEVYAAAMDARQQLRKNFRELFTNQRLDAIIFPTTILPARPIEGSLETVELNGEQVPTLLSYIHNTDPASIAALPGLSLPVGLTASGLPVGMEIDGPEQSDRRLLAVAKTLESIIGFDGRPPRRNQ